MKLYYATGACSLSPHIVSREAGLPVELSKVTFTGAERTTAEGENYFEVNPRGGYVPSLRLDDGDVLIEGPAIIHYLADLAQGTPDKKLLPAAGTKSYYEALSWITFISTELHKTFGPLHNPSAPQDVRQAAIDKVIKRYGVIETALEGKEWLNGDFSIADAYLYTIVRWSPKGPISLDAFPNIHAHVQRMETREAVMTALAEEGLEKMG